MLVDSGRILPVLDGLDMIGEGMRADAIAAINSLGPDVPLVVTSQVESYQQAVKEAECGLSRAAVVELLPLTLAEARDYLAPAGGSGRWRQMFAHLNDCPDGPLAQALQTLLDIPGRWGGNDAFGRGRAEVDQQGPPLRPQLADA
jgi:hypothetical protein